MPVRPLDREQAWLLPPTLEELIPENHPARFAAAFVDSLDRRAWLELGAPLEGEPLGAPEYHPRALLSVWVYGFMTGVRSTRKLEAACRDAMPYLWLTGWQHPDHNTLWRFYQAHRQSMRCILKRTVRVAVHMGLIDLAVQAVDGTKVKGDAAKDRTYDAAGLKRLLERTEAAIRDLEGQNETGGDPPPPHLPRALAQKERLRQQVQEALARVEREEGGERTNLTDPDAGLMKSRQGIVAGYNLQAMVSPLDPAVAPRGGLLLTGLEVTTDADDHEQLVPMLEIAEEVTGRRAEVTLADAGYHSGANLWACAEAGRIIVMPEAQEKAVSRPYHREHFIYAADTDTYTCPQGEVLHCTGVKQRLGRAVAWVYRASGAACRCCPAFGICTRDKRQGRALEVGPYDELLRRHREWMATPEAKAAYQRRKELPEPAFGIMKEQQGGRRFLLRGLANVRAEGTLLGIAFNLRTLWRVGCAWSDKTRQWTLAAMPMQRGSAKSAA